MWNPVSVVGQHMQQSGTTPAEAMAFTLASAIQYAEDCQARGLDVDTFLPRFTFFFDISISFLKRSPSSALAAVSGRILQKSVWGQKTRVRGDSSFMRRSQALI